MPTEPENPLISRKSAQRLGLKFYRTGLACSRGHFSARYVAKRICYTCHCMSSQTLDARIKAQKWRQENTETRKQYGALYYRENKQKHRERAKEWGATNPEKVRQSRKKYNSKHREKITASARDWRRKNPDRAVAATNRYLAKNPEYRRVLHATRRARLAAAEGKFSLDELRVLIEKQKGRCGCCLTSLKSGYHADHKMPISRGGDNTIENIELLCQPCNSRKYNKLPHEWALENGRLV